MVEPHKYSFKAVLLDIEGTTTPISFVADVLFPYASRELENYVYSNWNSEQMMFVVKSLRALALQDQIGGVSNVELIRGIHSYRENAEDKQIMQKI